MKLKSFTLLLLSFLLINGCIRWSSEFKTGTPSFSPSDTETLYNKALRATESADNAEKIGQAILAFENVLKADPQHYNALSYLSTLHILLGDAYSSKKSKKIDHFRSALIYSERAMYTNPDFRASIDRGDNVWEAAEYLTANEIDAMFFWTTALFYYYKEGLNALGQIIQYPWVKRARRVLEIMAELDPDWGGGAIYFTWGIYYLSIPESVGGDRELSYDYFQKAIETGPNWLLNRWGRAKYFHVKMQNPREFKEDLQWVVQQDISTSEGYYPWKIYFQKDAQNMLDNMDQYF